MRDTQIDAWDAIQDKLPDARGIVRNAIIGRPLGATLFELQSLLGWPINRISGRVTELAKRGLIQDGGTRRINPLSGKRGIVWVAIDKQDHRD